jgi:hypothetical protein
MLYVPMSIQGRWLNMIPFYMYRIMLCDIVSHATPNRAASTVNRVHPPGVGKILALLIISTIVSISRTRDGLGVLT